MFVEPGPDVPPDEIARRAGVAYPTVYRDLPDRDALMREVVCSVMGRTAEAAERTPPTVAGSGEGAGDEARGPVIAR